MIEWMIGFCMLIFLIIAIRQLFRKRPEMSLQEPEKTVGTLVPVVAVAAVAVAAVLTVPFTHRQNPNTDLYDPALQSSLISEMNDGNSVEENDPKSEEQPVAGSVFGYNDYTGYLDQCVQWLGCESFADCDYDGDGITDRVWRENIQDWGVADYRIEFGNGDLIELPKTGGGIPEVRALDLEGDGVKEILFTETFGYSTDPKAYGQMALFRKTGERYEMMTLPDELSCADSGEQTYEGTMVRYQPSLAVQFEAAGERLLRVTCPGSENVEGLKPLDVVVDLTQEQWEMGNYEELYPSDLSGTGGPYQVDILPGENGCDAVRLHFGVLDKWCNDDVAVTLVWQGESLLIKNIRYWHEYIETAYAEIDGQQYELILRGAGYAGGNKYTIASILVDHIYYDERFRGMVEDNVQLIDPSDAAKQYWGMGDVSEGSIMAKAFSSSRNGNIMVADLDFDGNEDFCIQGWIPEDSNVSYYCYFWDEKAGQFVYGGCLANVEPDEDLRCIRSTVYEEDGGYGIAYYRYEDGALVLERYRKEGISSDTVFERLDLTYAETNYSIDKADYLKDAPRMFRLAEQALTELYQMTGTKVEKTCFTVTEFGDFYFAMSENELKASQSYYDRCYGAQEGFEDCIASICIADGQAGYWLKASPVEYCVWPPGQDTMTDEEIVQWYFENSPLAQINQQQLGSAVVKTGDMVASIEETFEGTYVIRTKSGKYFELTYNEDTKRVNTYYGPYDRFPVH